jgi:hypothetical protein
LLLTMGSVLLRATRAGWLYYRPYLLRPCPTGLALPWRWYASLFKRGGRIGLHCLVWGIAGAASVAVAVHFRFGSLCAAAYLYQRSREGLLHLVVARLVGRVTMALTARVRTSEVIAASVSRVGLTTNSITCP